MNPIEVIAVCDRCGVEDCVHMGGYRDNWETEAAEAVSMEPAEAYLVQTDGEEVQDVQSFEELLIANLEARPVLWNSKLKISQRGKAEKDRLWLEIADFFGNQYAVPYLQKKWRNLRDQFVKTKGELEAYVPSGSGALPKKKTWKHFESLKFLLDSMTPRATTSNFASQGSSASPSLPPTPGTSQQSLSQGQTPRGAKRVRETDSSSEIIEAIKNLPPPPLFQTPSAPASPAISPICMRLNEMIEQAQLNPERRVDLEIQLLTLTKNFIFGDK